MGLSNPSAAEVSWVRPWLLRGFRRVTRWAEAEIIWTFSAEYGYNMKFLLDDQMVRLLGEKNRPCHAVLDQSGQAHRGAWRAKMPWAWSGDF